MNQQKVWEASFVQKLYYQYNLKTFSTQDTFLPDYETKIVRIYKQYFLSFEYYQQKKLTNFMDHKLLKKAHQVNVSNYLLHGEIEWQQHQISVFSVSEQQLQVLNHNLFTLDAISKNHGNQMVDIRIQHAKTDSFRPKDYAQKRLQLTIDQYLEYQKDQKEFIQNLINNGNSMLSLDNILFAVNVDMESDWVHETNALREVVPELSFGSKDDGLSYLRQHILGLSVPQIYIKVADVYTGGHQEHLAVSAINLNHGPGSSVWISIDQQFVPTLRQFVMKESQIDIMVEEGLWFRETEYFIQKGLEVKYTIQKPGDIIVLGPGCLHLVRSEGMSVQSAWNIMTKDLKMVQSMCARYQINQQTNYQTIIPIKTLFLDIYNHEKQILNASVACYLQQRLSEFFQQEKAAVKQLLDKVSQIRYVEYKRDTHEIISCSGCWHEIFIYFYMREGHKQGGQYDFYCVNCMEKELIQLPGKSGIICMKYKALVLGELLGQTNFNQCLDALCFSNYVGSVQCKRLFSKEKLTYHNYEKFDKKKEKIKIKDFKTHTIEVELSVEDTICVQNPTLVRLPKAIMGVQLHPTIELMNSLPAIVEEKKVQVQATMKKVYKVQKNKTKSRKRHLLHREDTEEIQREVEVIPIKKKTKTLGSHQDPEWNG